MAAFKQKGFDPEWRQLIATRVEPSGPLVFAKPHLALRLGDWMKRGKVVELDIGSRFIKNEG